MDKTFKFDGYENNVDRGEVIFNYNLVTPTESIKFSEKLTFPTSDFSNIPRELLNKILDSLSLVLAISYWKLYCPENIDLGEIKLTSDQARFWNELYINGLGEFFYKNKIDFTKLNLFSGNIDTAEPISIKRSDRSLVGMGGGKDSIVTAEVLKKAGKEFSTFTLSGGSIQEEIVDLLEVDNINVVRTIDPKLFELNKSDGVYNGHIPISAIYHFVGILLAALYDYKYVVLSNEASANYGNVQYLGREINHQWSKSLEFEKMIQTYVSSSITPDIIPFSLLRQMNEIKIVEIFSKYHKYFPLFSSCNTNFKIKKEEGSLWCGKCAKCLFMFSMLAAFLDKKEAIIIFGQNLFEKEELVDRFKELLGIRDHKPFDCVGTPEEMQLAFYLASKKGEYDQTPIMKMFCESFSDKFASIEESSDKLLSLSNEDTIPDEFKSLPTNI